MSLKYLIKLNFNDNCHHLNNFLSNTYDDVKFCLVFHSNRKKKETSLFLVMLISNKLLPSKKHEYNEILIICNSEQTKFMLFCVRNRHVYASPYNITA